MHEYNKDIVMTISVKRFRPDLGSIFGVCALYVLQRTVVREFKLQPLAFYQCFISLLCFLFLNSDEMFQFVSRIISL